MDVETYLDRLFKWLSYKVSMGLLGEDVAEQLYSATIAYIQNKRIKVIDPKRYREQQTSLPYVNEIAVPDWEWEESWNKNVSDVQAHYQKEFISQYDIQATKNEYLPLLEDYLKQANVTGEKAKAIIDEAERLIDLGVPVNQLPNIKGVSETTPSKERERQTKVEQFLRKEEAERIQRRVKELAATQYARYQPATEERFAEISEDQRRAREWEAQREEAIGQITDPRQWLVKQQLQRMANPYESAFHLMRGGISPQTLSYGMAPVSIPETVRRFAPGVASTYQGGIPYTPVQRAQFAQQPLTKVPIETPSGQAWAGMLPSQKEQLAGYAAYTGVYWPDIEARMRMMLPRSPGGGSRWRPARQRV